VEAYGLLLVSLVLGQNGSPVTVVAIASAQEGAGTTTTALNLGMMVARTGRKSLIVDANLRKPEVHSAFGVDQAPGVAEVLGGQKEVAEVIRPTNIPNLSALTAGKSTVPPQALLVPQRLAALLADLRARFEFLVVDTPPVLRFPDTLNMARVVDGMVLVVPAEGGSRRAQQEARRRLERVDAKILGAVLNKVSPREAVALSS
jgi:capsular exopolysaccharide synthesis family protein